MLKTRVLSAAVALLLIGPIIIFGGFWSVFVVAGIVLLGGMREYAKLAFSPGMGRDTLFLFYWGLIVYTCGAFQNREPSLLLTASAGSVMGVLIYQVFTLKSTGNAPQRAGLLLLGILYLPLLSSFFPALRSLQDGLELLIYSLIITWTGDSGAYFFGNWWGEKRLAPAISPGKTVVGVMGGVLWAISFSLLYRLLILKGMPLLHALLLPLVLEFFAVTGDLAESILKRAAGVKDSGAIMPGHGGVLDRIDALLFTVPATYFYGKFLYNQ